MSTTPDPDARYAVVSPALSGPYVTFWPDHHSVIHLMTHYANVVWFKSVGFSVWHRRSAKARWVCVSN